MLVLINGNPGTGKLSIGKNLSERIGGRLLDVHTVYNLSWHWRTISLMNFSAPFAKSGLSLTTLWQYCPSSSRSSSQRRWRTNPTGPQKPGADTLDWRKRADRFTSFTSIVHWRRTSAGLRRRAVSHRESRSMPIMRDGGTAFRGHSLDERHPGFSN